MLKWKELFTVPQDRKMTEKDLMRVLFSSISCILVCMMCLVSTTWALFSVTITSDNNAIQLGEFTTDVELTTQSREVILQAEEGYVLNEGTYVLTVTNTGNCRGYTEIMVTDGMGETAVYHTGTIPVGGTAGVNITIIGDGVELALNHTWGASPDPENPVLSIIAEGVLQPEETTEPSEPEETTEPSEPEETTKPSEPEETTTPSEPEGDPNLV